MSTQELKERQVRLAEKMLKLYKKHPPASEHVLGYLAWLQLYFDKEDLEDYEVIRENMGSEDMYVWLNKVFQGELVKISRGGDGAPAVDLA